MATPPTRVLVATPAVGWSSSATPKTTPTFSVQAGDLLTLMAFGENGMMTVAPPTWTGSGAWTLLQSISLGSDWCTAYLYVCTVTATATGRTVSVAASGTMGQFSFIVTQWRNHGGVGLSGKANASGAPSLPLALSANSAVAVGNSDWNAANGASRTWRTVNGSPIVESSYGGTVGSTYVVYTGYAPDAGAAGSETLGLTAPTGQKYSIVAVEVLGLASVSFSGVAAFSGAGTVTASGTPHRSGSIVMSAAGSLTAAGSPKKGGTVVLAGTGSMSTVGSPGVGGTVVLSGTGALSTVGSPALGGTAILTGTGALVVVGTPHLTGLVALDGTGALDASGTGTTEGAGTAALSGAGALETSGAPRLAGTTSVASTGILVLAGAISVAGAVSYAGTGALSARSTTPQAHGALTARIAPRSRLASLTERRTAGRLQPIRWAGKLR